MNTVVIRRTEHKGTHVLMAVLGEGSSFARFGEARIFPGKRGW